MNVSQRHPDMEVSPIPIGPWFRLHSPGSIKLVQRIRPDRDGPQHRCMQGLSMKGKTHTGLKRRAI
jgi:hypothetical protein